jgi:hypothetical protein
MTRFFSFLVIIGFTFSAQAADFVYGYYYTVEHSCSVYIAHKIQTGQIDVRMSWKNTNINFFLDNDVTINEFNHIVINKTDEAHTYDMDFLVDPASRKLTEVHAKVDGSEVPCGSNDLLLYGAAE